MAFDAGLESKTRQKLGQIIAVVEQTPREEYSQRSWLDCAFGIAHRAGVVKTDPMQTPPWDGVDVYDLIAQELGVTATEASFMFNSLGMGGRDGALQRIKTVMDRY